MKKLTHKQLKEITRADSIMKNIVIKGEKLRIEERVLRHTRDVKIPRQIRKNNKIRDKLSKRWNERGKALGLWD